MMIAKAYRTVLAVHRGALGDFLNVWPALLALCSGLPDTVVEFHGPSGHLPWATAAGCAPPSPEHVRLLASLFRDAPPPLPRDIGIVWFGLMRRPPLPEGENILFLPGLPPDCNGQPLLSRPPREAYRTGLAQLSIPWREDFVDVWRDRLCPVQPHAPDTLLLFPGAGHQAKLWPMVKFLELAGRLARQGYQPAFVLGPAEVEREVDAPGFRVLRPDSLDGLLGAVTGCRLALGNDCGPMHLAGLCSIPGLVLFGPTAEALWTPIGARTVSLPLPCRPCTRTTADITCLKPRCLSDLSVETVLAAALELLEEGKRG